MNSKYHCTQCNTYYTSSTLLKNHRKYKRDKGEIEGHELRVGQSIAASSVVGSQVGTKDTRIEDVEFNPPDKVKIQSRKGFTK